MIFDNFSVYRDTNNTDLPKFSGIGTDLVVKREDLFLYDRVGVVK